MPRYMVTIREISTYELEASTEDEATELVRSAIRGERVLAPAAVEHETLEVEFVPQAPVPAAAVAPTDPPADPRDDPADPLVRMPRIL